VIGDEIFYGFIVLYLRGAFVLQVELRGGATP